MSNDSVPIDEKIIVQSRIISLNSKYATDKINGSKLSNVSFDFNSIASKNRETLYHTVAIQSAEITASYYNVNSSNNVINITQGGFAAQAIAIPEGNYDAETFATAFNAGAGATYPVTLAFNSTTGKFSLVSATLAITLNVAATTAQSIIDLSVSRSHQHRLHRCQIQRGHTRPRDHSRTDLG